MILYSIVYNRGQPRIVGIVLNTIYMHCNMVLVYLFIFSFPTIVSMYNDMLYNANTHTIKGVVVFPYSSNPFMVSFH